MAILQTDIFGNNSFLFFVLKLGVFCVLQTHSRSSQADFSLLLSFQRSHPQSGDKSLWSQPCNSLCMKCVCVWGCVCLAVSLTYRIATGLNILHTREERKEEKVFMVKKIKRKRGRKTVWTHVCVHRLIYNVQIAVIDDDQWYKYVFIV